MTALTDYVLPMTEEEAELFIHNITANENEIGYCHLRLGVFRSSKEVWCNIPDEHYTVSHSIDDTYSYHSHASLLAALTGKKDLYEADKGSE